MVLSLRTSRPAVVLQRDLDRVMDFGLLQPRLILRRCGRIASPDELSPTLANCLSIVNSAVPPNFLKTGRQHRPDFWQ